MPRLRENGNLGVGHGCWGEAVACDFLRAKGYEIFERNATPYERDRRLEIDIVAYDHLTDTMVFVEVKQHGKRSAFARRLAGVDRRKRLLLRRACNAWRRVNGWRGAYRFDVIEVWGEIGHRPEIDHVMQVELFPVRGRFVKWS